MCIFTYGGVHLKSSVGCRVRSVAKRRSEWWTRVSCFCSSARVNPMKIYVLKRLNPVKVYVIIRIHIHINTNMYRVNCYTRTYTHNYIYQYVQGSPFLTTFCVVSFRFFQAVIGAYYRECESIVKQASYTDILSYSHDYLSIYWNM